MIERAERPPFVSEEDWAELITATGDLSYGDREALRHLVVKMARDAYESRAEVYEKAEEEPFSYEPLTKPQELALLELRDSARRQAEADDNEDKSSFVIHSGAACVRSDVVDRLFAAGMLRRLTATYKVVHRKHRYQFTDAAVAALARIDEKKGSK